MKKSPTTATLSLSASEATLLPSVVGATQALYEATNELESLASDLCNPYPVPGINKDDKPAGIIGQIRQNVDEQYQLVDRIRAAINMIRSAL